ncbi:MAG: hypothetical protein HY961_13270 [Ignavibacteriae bacterium]|nr:hypothetical protein [Ignavibacteriota bacterium]
MVAKGSNIPFYFVLYLVAVVTVFGITHERDQLMAQRAKDMARLVNMYLKPLQVSPYIDTSRYFIGPAATALNEPVQLRTKIDGPVDKSDVQFSLVSARRHTSERSESFDAGKAKLLNENGDGVLVASSLPAGLYAFTVAAYKPRVLVEGNLAKVLVMDSTYVIPFSNELENVDRDTTVVYALIEKSGVIPNQLTLNVQEPSDNWVVGTPYRKKIFMGGVTDLMRIRFTANGGTIERSPHDQQFVTFVWETPTVGKKSFSVSANANRGFGGIDNATTSFVVDVVPPAFVARPSSKAFWGIPYEFDGQISGLNPLDLSVETLHDGQSLGSKPAVPKQAIIAERNWKRLGFRVLYKGSAVKEHTVTLENPPPPQVRWVQQRLDKSNNTFVVVATSTDPTGGPVRVSLQTQPSGIARIDKIQGTEFTITVNLAEKPSAVFMKVVVTDKYGGQSVSTKQFNIPS